jgi:hypothetical protein
MATSTKKPEVQRPLTERLDRTLIMDPKAPRPPRPQGVVAGGKIPPPRPAKEATAR